MSTNSFLPKIWRKCIGLATTAKDPVFTDVYLVEFPKSGVTWLANILANTALLQSGRPELVTFGNGHYYVPDIHVSRRIGPPIHNSPPCRLIKSHSEWNPNYNFVIYLARHPLAVMKSYFRFLKEIGRNAPDNFHDFCKSKKFGIPSWKRHIDSWLNGPVSFKRLHLIRYEDLMQDAFGEITALSDNYGWNFDADKIRRAISRSSIKAMQDSEDVYRKRDPRYTMRFIRGGNDVDVDNLTVSYIETECERELKALGYSDDYASN